MGRRGQQSRRPSFQMTDELRRDIAQIIQGRSLEDTRKLVERAETIGAQLQQEGLRSTQIRNIFGTVRKIEAMWQPQLSEDQVNQAVRQLQLLKPKLAYTAERNRPVRPLAEILTEAIDLVGDNRDYFGNFVDFFEAILAYHVAEGGR